LQLIKQWAVRAFAYCTATVLKAMIAVDVQLATAHARAETCVGYLPDNPTASGYDFWQASLPARLIVFMRAGEHNDVLFAWVDGSSAESGTK